jgi:hypothetical protein
MRFRNNIIVRFVSGMQKRGVVNISTANSLKHELTKTEICYKLKAVGKEYITEAKLQGGGRTDILVLDDGMCIEILVSEKLNNVEWKCRKYPQGLQIVAVKSTQDYDEEKWKTINIGDY